MTFLRKKLYESLALYFKKIHFVPFLPTFLSIITLSEKIKFSLIY